MKPARVTRSRDRMRDTLPGRDGMRYEMRDRLATKNG
jgi:hypothetical protein